MNTCKVCGGTEFYKEAGYYFCTECQTQNEDKREEILELRLEGIQVTKRKFRQNKSEKIDHKVQWSTWEQYNFILIGLVDELIELGATSQLKLTVLQLWTFYLKKAEIAFISTKRKKIPKLACNFHKKDADIIYGKLKRKRKRKKVTSNSSIASSQPSETSSVRELNRYKRMMFAEEYNRLAASQASDSDAHSLLSQSLHSIRSGDNQSSAFVTKLRFSNHAKQEMRKLQELSKKLPMSQRSKYQRKHVTTKYRTGPYVITPMKLWVILYLALRIHNQDIHLADMLRYGREGHLSYYRIDHLLPADMTLSNSDVKLLSQSNELTHKGMRRTSAVIAKFLFVFELNCPDFMLLIKRYCKELSLPKRISAYVKRLIALSPPKMIFTNQEPLIPNYEGRAMAFIIVVLKVLLGLDGITEYETSRIAERINRRILFNMPASKHKYNCKPVMQGIAESIYKTTTLSPHKSGNACIIVHGGCGLCSDSIVCEKLDGCRKAVSLGYKKIMDGGNALDAVQAALWWLECDESFNCGYGSVLNQLGQVQTDASIMDGDKLEIGSIAAVSDIEHPISLAKFVLENYPNTIMVGEGAKNLSRCTDTHCISKGNMVSPKAMIALNSYKNCDPVLRYNVDDLEHADLLKKSWGTTGCVAWDGQRMAAGTTTGGLSGKMVGRIGDSPLLGCGTFANSLAGCSLSGHGETISKLGIARSVVTEIMEGSCPENALKLNIDSMQRQSNRESGGIVLERNGCWGVYFTTPRMPYAVVKKDIITFGADLYEKRTENKVEAEGDLNSKLFSFREWQRYIECRRNLLMRKHFPTKYKNDPDAFGNTELYVRFITLALSRRKDKPEISSYKNMIPRDLTTAMEQCATMLGKNHVNTDNVDIFEPSLTPQYSYLEQLLEHPMYDLPDILRSKFSETKTHYLTNPKKLIDIAAEYGIRLEIVESRLHFLNQIVPQFAKLKMPSLGKLNAPVIVMSCSNDVDSNSPAYLETRKSNRFSLNTVNQSLYDTIQKKPRTRDSNKAPEAETSMTRFGSQESDEDDSDFGFKDVTREGKLLVPSFHDSGGESEAEFEFSVANNSRCKNEGLPFYQKYNLQLPDYHTMNESESPDKINYQALPKSNKTKDLTRDLSGKFVAKDSKRTREDPVVYKSPRRRPPCSKNIEDMYSPSEQDPAFDSSDKSVGGKVSDISEKLFIPSKDYWMYHCVFSRVKPKNFESFESELPVSFQWLLNECADVVEMSTEDLYEQVCLVETYFAHILRPCNSKPDSQDSKKNQTKLRVCKQKW